jgi:hypothetical protein
VVTKTFFIASESHGHSSLDCSPVLFLSSHVSYLPLIMHCQTYMKVSYSPTHAHACSLSLSLTHTHTHTHTHSHTRSLARPPARPEDHNYLLNILWKPLDKNVELGCGRGSISFFTAWTIFNYCSMELILWLKLIYLWLSKNKIKFLCWDFGHPCFRAL